MISWTRLLSPVGARRTIAVLGGLYVVFAFVRAVVEIDRGEAVGTILVVTGLIAIPGFVLVYGAYWLSRSDVDAEFYSDVAGWALVGVGAMVGILLVYHVQPDGEISRPATAPPILTSLASLAGFAVGVYDGRAKTRTHQLEESEAKFRILAENLEEVVWMSDPDTQEILYLNPAFEDVWGRDRESLYEDSTTFLEDVHPDDRQRVAEAYARMPEDGFDEEYRIVRLDGEVRWLTVRGDPICAGETEHIIGIADDVTERKARERALAESERRYRALVEHFPDGAVGLFDENLEYTAVGGQLLDAVGVEPGDRIGSSVTDIYPDEIVEMVEPYFHAALDGEVNEIEVEFHGRHLFAHTLPVMNADDEVYGGMLVVQDVTQRAEYERKLEASNERLEQFAYAVSHDLQEPLRMVSSYVQLIERRYGDELDEDAEEFIEFAVDGADRMREMIDGLLEYSRVETQGSEFEPVDLDIILADVRDTLQLKIDDHDAEITADPLPRVEGDEKQLRQVFQNLLSNAIDYSGDEPPSVHVSAERNGTNWVVSVDDEGVGIDRADQERIFELFERGGDDTAPSGTGIGLALSRRIVDRHGGDIWAESEPGEGTTVSFTLPPVPEVTDD